MASSEAKSSHAAILWGCATLLVLAVLRYGLTPIAGYDFWWHIKLGEQTWLAQEVISKDLFSTNGVNSTWAYQDWGSALFFFAIHKLAGIPGLVLLKTLIFLLTIIALAYLCKKIYNTPDALTFLLLALAIPAMEFRFTERPQIFSFFLPALILIVIERHRLKDGSIYWVIPLTLILANFHRGVLIVPAILFIYWLSTHPKLSSASTKMSVDGFLAFLGTTLASFSTPFGFSSIEGTLNLAGTSSFRANLSEWAPLSLDTLLQASPLSLAYLTFTLIAFLFVRPQKHAWQCGLAILGLLTLSRGIRMAPLLPILTIPLIVATLGIYKNVWQQRLEKMIIVTSALMALVISISTPLPPPALSLSPYRYPEKALDFVHAQHSKQPLKGNTLNEYHFGGYIIFHLWPDYKVYIDGRADTVYDADFFQKYARVLKDPKILNSEASKHSIEWLFLEYNPSLISRAHLDQNKDWTLIYWDRSALIYVRSAGANKPLAERLGYQILSPYNLDKQLSAEDFLKSNRETIQSDIEHLRKDDSGNPTLAIIEEVLTQVH